MRIKCTKFKTKKEFSIWRELNLAMLKEIQAPYNVDIKYDKDIIKNHNLMFIKNKDTNDIVGVYTILNLPYDQKFFQMFYIKPEYRNQKIGTTIVRKIFKKYPRILFNAYYKDILFYVNVWPGYNLYIATSYIEYKKPDIIIPISNHFYPKKEYKTSMALISTYIPNITQPNEQEAQWLYEALDTKNKILDKYIILER